MPRLIDTHAHLDDPRFAADLPAVITRAAAAGVERIVAVATDLDSARAVLALARRFATLTPTVGIHPNHAAQAGSGDWDEIIKLAADPQVVGLGETGLDRYRNHTPFAVQEDYFARHLELARRLGLPVVIHCRDADADVLRLVREAYDRHGPVRGVLHSFCGAIETAAACVAMGLYVSFAGMVTYPKADDVRALAASVPADRILVETDCPYLAPVPVRGKRNEPAYVAHTAACVAAARGEEAEVFAAQTTRNAGALFTRS